MTVYSPSILPRRGSTSLLLMGLLLLGLLISSGSHAHPIKLTIAYEIKPNPPFILGHADQVAPPTPGSSVALLKALEERLDVEVEFVRIPWKRGLKQLEYNLVDGLFHASYRPERRSIGVYPMLDNERPDPAKRITRMEYHLYKNRKDDWRWDGSEFDGLDGPVAAMLGYSVANDLRALEIEVNEGASVLNNLKMLTSQRVSAVASLGGAADQIITRNPEQFGTIEKIRPAFKSKVYYLMLSRRFVAEHPQLAEQIWKQIAQLRDSGRFEALQ